MSALSSFPVTISASERAPGIVLTAARRGGIPVRCFVVCRRWNAGQLDAHLQFVARHGLQSQQQGSELYPIVPPQRGSSDSDAVDPGTVGTPQVFDSDLFAANSNDCVQAGDVMGIKGNVVAGPGADGVVTLRKHKL